jgi:5'-phosphate synthase pdxT subunit
MVVKKIGILAIQGDFEKHSHAIYRLGLEVIEVRTKEELERTDALIIPGGESTTFLKLFQEFNLENSIREYVKNKPIMGTCAGLIILSKEAHPLPYKPLGLIDIIVERNAYGRQRESFIENIDLYLNGEPCKFLGVFIRAPKICHIGKDVKILARHNQDAVLVCSGNILVATFHPELTENTNIHKYFIDNFIH